MIFFAAQDKFLIFLIRPLIEPLKNHFWCRMIILAIFSKFHPCPLWFFYQFHHHKFKCISQALKPLVLHVELKPKIKFEARNGLFVVDNEQFFRFN